MSKELKALENIWKEINNFDENYGLSYEKINTNIHIIKQALTPPTADELKEAINYFKNRTSFEIPVYDKPQFKTILKYNQILYENWQECERQLEAPTADEVCEALGEYLSTEVLYKKETKEFYYSYKYDIVRLITEVYFSRLNLEYRINLFLPTYINTMIGQFYEGKSEKE